MGETRRAGGGLREGVLESRAFEVRGEELVDERTKKGAGEQSVLDCSRWPAVAYASSPCLGAKKMWRPGEMRETMGTERS